MTGAALCRGRRGGVSVRAGTTNHPSEVNCEGVPPLPFFGRDGVRPSRTVVEMLGLWCGGIWFGVEFVVRRNCGGTQ